MNTETPISATRLQRKMQKQKERLAKRERTAGTQPLPKGVIRSFIDTDGKVYMKTVRDVNLSVDSDNTLIWRSQLPAGYKYEIVPIDLGYKYDKGTTTYESTIHITADGSPEIHVDFVRHIPIPKGTVLCEIVNYYEIHPKTES